MSIIQQELNNYKKLEFFVVEDKQSIQCLDVLKTSMLCQASKSLSGSKPSYYSLRKLLSAQHSKDFYCWLAMRIIKKAPSYLSP